ESLRNSAHEFDLSLSILFVCLIPIHHLFSLDPSNPVFLHPSTDVKCQASSRHAHKSILMKKYLRPMQLLSARTQRRLRS
ncbi:hypothetical protein DFH94DRAFT_756684, partial [Russula ochroleuca]